MTYLDNAATTAVCPAAAEKAVHMMTTCFGNPSSLHAAGLAAERELTAARAAVAKLMGATPETVVFTSGGSACSKGKQSPVLRAMGLPAAEIDSALRISLCRDNTADDIDRFLTALHEADAALTRVAAFRR